MLILLIFRYKFLRHTCGCQLHTYVCMSHVILILFLLRKKIYNKVKDFIHFNVSLSLLMSLILFIVGNEVMDDSNVS